MQHHTIVTALALASPLAACDWQGTDLDMGSSSSGDCGCTSEIGCFCGWGSTSSSSAEPTDWDGVPFEIGAVEVHGDFADAQGLWLEPVEVDARRMVDAWDEIEIVARDDDDRRVRIELAIWPSVWDAAYEPGAVHEWSEDDERWVSSDVFQNVFVSSEDDVDDADWPRSATLGVSRGGPAGSRSFGLEARFHLYDYGHGRSFGDQAVGVTFQVPAPEADR